MKRPLLAAALLLVATSLAWGSRDERVFPHEKHVRVFPTCFSCHEGVRTGQAGRVYPAAQVCANCHDGQQLKKVDWTGPTRRPTNLQFSHASHAEAASFGMAPTECAACHRQPGRTEFMAVQRAVPENCIGCHEGRQKVPHLASAHFAPESPCATCHVPITKAAAFTAERIARLPKPPSHGRADFLLDHAPGKADNTQSCATCHSRESCERCHMNGDKVNPIASLGTDARIASLTQGRTGSYPTPRSHTDSDFISAHGAAAKASAATCANCHSQQSCRSCHIGDGAAKQIAELPVPKKGDTRGVRLERASNWATTNAALTRAMAGGERRPIADFANDTGAARHLVRVHPQGYDRQHDVDASTRRLNCESCHAKRFCADCHEGEGRRRYHSANFLQKHAPDAYGRSVTCSSCHNPEVFCKSCHEKSGLGTRGALNTAYHNAQPDWLLRHPQAARQDLQACATCHQQRDCMRCHSQAGWGVNPHGPGFNPEAMAKRNRNMCLACHFSDPLQKH